MYITSQHFELDDHYDFENFFATEGQFKNLFKATEYSNNDTICNFFNRVNDNLNGTGTTFEVFIDPCASSFLAQQELCSSYGDKNTQIINVIDENTRIQHSEERGVFLVNWRLLFQAKIVLIETTTMTRLIIGFINTTQSETGEDAAHEELFLISDSTVTNDTADLLRTSNQKEQPTVEEEYYKLLTHYDN